MRKLFNLPIRKDTTALFHTDKISLDEFVSDIQNACYPFKNNLKELKIDEPKHIEEWFEIFLSWNEVEPEIEQN